MRGNNMNAVIESDVIVEESDFQEPRFINTRKCGCGNCKFLPESKEGCPEKDSKTAIWLWAGNPNYKAPLVIHEEGDPGYELKEITGTE